MPAGSSTGDTASTIRVTWTRCARVVGQRREPGDGSLGAGDGDDVRHVGSGRSCEGHRQQRESGQRHSPSSSRHDERRHGAGWGPSGQVVRWTAGTRSYAIVDLPGPGRRQAMTDQPSGRHRQATGPVSTLPPTPEAGEQQTVARTPAVRRCPVSVRPSPTVTLVPVGRCRRPGSRISTTHSPGQPATVDSNGRQRSCAATSIMPTGRSSHGGHAPAMLAGWASVGRASRHDRASTLPHVDRSRSAAAVT